MKYKLYTQVIACKMLFNRVHPVHLASLFFYMLYFSIRQIGWIEAIPSNFLLIEIKSFGAELVKNNYHKCGLYPWEQRIESKKCWVKF